MPIAQGGGAQALEHVVPHVPVGTTMLFAAILAAMIMSLALEERLHAKKSLIVGLFAMVSLLLGAILLPIPFGPYSIGGHDIAMPVYIPAVDWGVDHNHSRRVFVRRRDIPVGAVHLDCDPIDEGVEW